MKSIAALILSAGVASAGLAQVHPCPADTNVDGQLTPADFGAWISAFNAATPICDQNGDTLCSPADFGAWISNYNAGCNLSDSDNDRIPNIYENNTGLFTADYATGTNPNNADSDGDNIDDGNEAYGTADGLNLPGMGANPNRKTIFVEIDWTEDNHETAFHSHRPRPGTVARTAAAFANAPLANPDGSTGIDFIVDYGQGGLFNGGQLLFAGTNPRILIFADSIDYRDTYMDARRSGIFHYGIFTHQYDDPTNYSSGVAYLNYDVFFVTLYQYWDWDEGLANTLMHEIGHNFGLHHGGNESRNRKPNYNSVLNYNNQFPGIDTNCDGFGDGVLDYSRGTNPMLDELFLSEAAGICGVPIDWNENGSINGGTVSRNINCASLNTTNCGSSSGCDDSSCDVLTDHNDWANMNFLGLGRALHPVRVDCDNPVPNP